MTTKRIQNINQKQFTVVTLDLNKEVFVVYIAYLDEKISIYPA